MSQIKHVAVIMDGNGRWAQLRGRPRTYGHVKGVRVAKKIITHASQLGIPHLTLYAFSTENWFRPEEEVSVLMKLLERYLLKETDNLIRENIQFHTIGDLSKIPTHVRTLIEQAKQKTSHCSGLKVNFAISYGSRQELITAVQAIAQDVQSGKTQISEINEDLISKKLMTSHCPDPDLIIRTSGESRLSNFLMWQASYSELYFTNILWPDFKENDFNKALTDFKNRNRRFGKIESAIKSLFNIKEKKSHHDELYI
ncbi:MAG: isoprenyl transferase [Pseudobdellovibrio sp.]